MIKGTGTARITLARIGLNPAEIAHFMANTSSHELMVLKNFVTDSNSLNSMSSIKGLEKPKEIIQRNLTFALKASQTTRFGNHISVTQGLLLYGVWFII